MAHLEDCKKIKMLKQHLMSDLDMIIVEYR